MSKKKVTKKVSSSSDKKGKRYTQRKKPSVRALPSEKRTKASRENLKKANLLLGVKNIVTRDLPHELIDKRITNTLTKEHISRVISCYALSTLAEVTRAANDPKLAMIERIVCKIILKAYKGEDIFRLEFILQRCIGKVTDKIEVTKPTEFSHLSMEDLKAKHAEYAAKNLERIREIERKEIEAKTIELSIKDYKVNEIENIDGQDTEDLSIDDDPGLPH